jgi:hypothetical protein
MSDDIFEYVRREINSQTPFVYTANAKGAS